MFTKNPFYISITELCHLHTTQKRKNEQQLMVFLYDKPQKTEEMSSNEDAKLAENA